MYITLKKENIMTKPLQTNPIKLSQPMGALKIYSTTTFWTIIYIY